MEKLLEDFRPYIAQHRDFDIVLSKFGPVYVYPVDRQGELHEAEVLDGPKGIVETVAFQMICDAIEVDPGGEITKEMLSSVQSRVLSCMADLESADDYANILERYLKQFEEVAL